MPTLARFELGTRSEPLTSAVKRQQNLEETQVKNVLERINLPLLISTMTAETVLTMVLNPSECEPGSG